MTFSGDVGLIEVTSLQSKLTNHRRQLIGHLCPTRQAGRISARLWCPSCASTAVPLTLLGKPDRVRLLKLPRTSTHGLD